MRGIYAITRILTGTTYFGQSGNMEGRWTNHRYDLGRNKHRNEHLQRAWNKYGKDAFIFVPLEIIEDLYIPLTPIEQKYYDSTTNRYNETRPGEPPSHSSIARKKISEALKGKRFSEEHKKNLSIAHKGQCTSLGFKHTLEQIKKNSEGHKGQVSWNKGKPMTEEQKRKISLAQTGTKRSDTAKKKMSEAQKGNQNAKKAKPL
jgi:hypothetical protein